MSTDIDKMSVNAIRVLAADAVQKAKSGHPGLPLGCAAVGYELFGYVMNHNPKDPEWPNRDRFILSGGHGSTLLYSLLHLFGYGQRRLNLVCGRRHWYRAVRRILPDPHKNPGCHPDQRRPAGFRLQGERLRVYHHPRLR